MCTFRTALIAGIVMATGATSINAGTSSPPTSAQYQAGWNAAIGSDGGASAVLPSGKDLWVAGDVTRVGATSVMGAWGFPHGAFMETAPGSSMFKVITFNGEHFGSDYWNGTPNTSHYYQPEPNWSDGTFFWAAFPVIDKGVLNVIGERVRGGSSFSIVGSYDAVFNASTLQFERYDPVPAGAGDAWSGVALGTGGWLLTSQYGAVAFVPSGSLATGSAWRVHPGAVPSSAGSWLVHSGSRWDLFGAQYAETTIQRWTSASPTGPWSAPSSAGMLPSPQDDGGMIIHPELHDLSGEAIISWAVNSQNFYGQDFSNVRT